MGNDITYNELDAEEKKAVDDIRQARKYKQQSEMLRTFICSKMIPDYEKWYVENGRYTPTYSTYCNWLDEQDYDLAMFDESIVSHKVMFKAFSDAWHFIAEATKFSFVPKSNHVKVSWNGLQRDDDETVPIVQLKTT